MGLITSLDVSLSTKVSEDVRNFAVTTPELRIVTTAYTTRIVNMVAGCVPTAADIPVDTTSLTDKSITNLQRVAEVSDAAQSAAAAAETKSDEALAAATTAQSSADAAMAQAEAATDMAATNTLSISNILANFAAWVLGTYLAALTLLDAAIADGDSIQAMAGKLQGQLNAVKVRLGILENNTILDVTLAVDTVNVTLTFPSTESRIVLEYGSITGTNNSDGSSSNCLINGVNTANYIMNGSRLSSAYIYTGRYSTFGKLFITKIATGLLIEHTANSGYGTTASSTYSNRNVIGQMDIAQTGISSIFIIGSFKAGTSFKIRRQW